MYRLTGIILLSLLLAGVCRGQPYTMLHYTQENGLPGNNVYRIFQDTDGMIWFATDKGVARYNGLQFEHFTTANGLPDNDIFFFTKDQEGRLWMGTYNGELVFYKDGIFHTAKNTSFLRSGVSMNTAGFIQKQEDSSIIFFYKGIDPYLVLKKNKLRIYRPPPGYILWDLYKKNKDTFIAYSFRGKTPVQLTLDADGKKLSEKPVPVDSKPGWDLPYYLGGGNKLYNRQYQLLRTLPDSFSAANHINALYESPDHFFVCTNYGLWVDHTLILPGHRISSVMQDRQGDYWISTLEKGVYRLPARFAATFSRSQVYQGWVVNSMQEQEYLQFGTTLLNLYALSDTGVRILFNFNEAYHKPLKTTHSRFLRAGKDYLLFTTLRNFRIHPGTAAAPEPLAVLEPFNYGVKDVVPGKGDHFYLQIIDRVMDVPLSVLFSGRLQGPSLTGIDSVRVYQLRMAPDSTFWLSNVNGIYVVKGPGAILQPQFGNLRLRQMIFCRNYLAGIDPVNRLVIVPDYRQPRVHIDTSVKNDCIWDKFYRLTDSSILVTTNNYYRLITFGSAPPGYRINVLEYPFIPQLAEHIAADSSMCYFFKNMAVTGIPIRELIQQPALPRLHFTFLKAGRKTLAADTFLRLQYKDSRDMSLYYNTLSFNTAAISFEQSIYSGDQPEHWTRSNGSNIDLFNIAHGTYYISIRARTFGGRYSVIQTLQLQIVPPFWFSWWFLVLIIFVTAFLVFVVVRAFARGRLAQKERENKFLRSEFTALNALMNPHFVFNSLNSVQSLINKEDLSAANQYVRTISDLLRQNMHNISRELIPLEKELELIINYLKLEKLRFKERLQYHIDLAQDVDEEFVMIPPLLVQPLVENAIKYTLAFSEISTGEISIRVYNDRDKTIIEVTDNGKGLNAAKIQRDPGHQSTALENIRTRLEQLSQIHNKTYFLEIMELKDGLQVTGTRARITIEL